MEHRRNQFLYRLLGNGNDNLGATHLGSGVQRERCSIALPCTNSATRLASVTVAIELVGAIALAIGALAGEFHFLDVTHS